MVAIQVRHVPDDVRGELIEAARREGVSLQHYLLDVLDREARQARRRRWLDGVRPATAGEGAGATATELIRRDRDSAA
ncbi:MAG: hypothetical protein CMH38_14900 [Microbacterium sp.]|jgi:post-segregation antitoxin (ccd killing protein)|uniref:hypothetical protein n=1 Tax=unclassified Microbacterium TaxID=2609290 RepID=UPI0008D8DDFC|nr:MULTISPECIES: hypothetical protein [unclassified Microbacterium]MAY51173.1 hypothetical protein [Microbacterium sp.]HAM13814.1 hypothetical protein [Microbacterium sp.]HAS32565.1 hypothetical protein [Microbacterium sp.]HBR89815.1 hypothetical protein [Microbacterium sp.]HBS73136.1 hypothetical protein [Microbacterium sp.]|tara:strand:+ start:43969 stop:44202 length:234 start_codon:yes stop_codon:yes gene_type:complete